jgi:hypothetical protein
MAWTMLRFTLCAAAIGVAGTGALLPVTVLELENSTSGRVTRLALQPGEMFSVTYHHSMYEQPVTEDFLVDARGHIALKWVSSPSAAVREYFGLTSSGERHAVERSVQEIVFRVATGTPQRLSVAGVERSFLEFGDHGDRLVMRAIVTPAVEHWLTHLLDTTP